MAPNYKSAEGLRQNKLPPNRRHDATRPAQAQQPLRPNEVQGKHCPFLSGTTRARLPADGGNSAVGKAICQQLTAAARAEMAQIKQAREIKQTQGATNDN
ncbi:MAG: hypothetical protein NT075_37565 [Chloroflexi bacterium]|nr:hypothetical protein [Chloroflexota bacterium]